MKVRILTPHKALKLGLHVLAGDVVDIAAEAAEVLIRDGAASPTNDAVGPFVDPEPTGYAGWSWEKLQREAKARGIEGRDRMGLRSAIPRDPAVGDPAK